MAMQVMREGDVWELVLPSELAYGNAQRGKHITPGSVLIFELEIIQVKSDAWFTRENVSNTLPLLAIAAVMGLTLFAFINTDAAKGGAGGAGGGGGKQAGFGPEVPLVNAAGAPGNPRVFFELAIGKEPAGRVVVELFKTVCPRTAENFRALWCVAWRGLAWPAGRGGGARSSSLPALPCPALPCPALPCPALPCPALPCPALPRWGLQRALGVRPCCMRSRDGAPTTHSMPVPL
eukprot:SAG22_NODE_1547_length_4151_cov_3.067868_5_plen_235_part_00